jgi:NTE family protein
MTAKYVPPQIRKDVREVNVALGGGGAKGFVHAGVLAALVDRGYTIASIVGTSIGAIVGSLFAYNAAVRYKEEPDPQKKAAEAVRQLLMETNFLELFDINWRSPLQGPVRGAKIEEWLGEQLYDPEKQDPISFYNIAFDLHLTATDYQTGDCLDLCEKNCAEAWVSTAVRASMSIQGLFRATEITYRTKKVSCWDGGTTGNCRFDLAHAIDRDRLTVGCSLTYRGEPTRSRTLLGIAGRSADIWLRQIENVTEELLGRPDHVLVVRPDLGDSGTLKFWMGPKKRRRLMDNGFTAMNQHLDAYEGAAR